ncbi:MAG: hypothetical protein GXY38_09920 [Planctomycetes bacterium]|nr:hypothetical protein [Planctomycetota bacterium]
MQYRARTQIVAALLIGFLSAAVLSGCSDKGSRADNIRLRSQMTQAQQLIDDAVNLADKPPVKVEGSEVVEVVSGAVNPQALVKLTEACAVVRKALADCPQADAQVKAMAKAQLASAGRLHGWLLAGKALDDISAAQDLLSRQQLLGIDARSAGAKARYAKLLLDGIAAGHRPKPTEELAKTRASMTEVNKKIEQLTAKRGEVLARVETLSREGSDLSLQSRVAQGENILTLADQAMEKQLAASEASLEVSLLSDEIEKLQAQADQMTWSIGLMESLSQVAGDSQQKAGQEAKEIQQRMQAANAAGAESLQKIQELADQAAQKIEAGAKTQQQALEILKDALNNATAAASGAASSDMCQRASLRGNVAMTLGDVYARRLALADKLAAITADIGQVYTELDRAGDVPASIGVLAQTYMPDAQSQRKDAQDAYQAALDAYKRAASAVSRREDSWAYQAQIGVAAMALYRQTKDASHLQEARDAMARALAGKEASPYLADVAAMQKGLEAQ